MASAMDAYNLLQQAVNSGSEEETQALVKKSMDTLKQAASGEPANSGTTADTQGENQTGLVSDVGQISVDGVTTNLGTTSNLITSKLTKEQESQNGYTIVVNPFGDGLRYTVYEGDVDVNNLPERGLFNIRAQDVDKFINSSVDLARYRNDYELIGNQTGLKYTPEAMQFANDYGVFLENKLAVNKQKYNSDKDYREFIDSYVPTYLDINQKNGTKLKERFETIKNGTFRRTLLDINEIGRRVGGWNISTTAVNDPLHFTTDDGVTQQEADEFNKIIQNLTSLSKLKTGSTVIDWARILGESDNKQEALSNFLTANAAFKNVLGLAGNRDSNPRVEEVIARSGNIIVYSDNGQLDAGFVLQNGSFANAPSSGEGLLTYMLYAGVDANLNEGIITDIQNQLTAYNEQNPNWTTKIGQTLFEEFNGDTLGDIQDAIAYSQKLSAAGFNLSPQIQVNNNNPFNTEFINFAGMDSRNNFMQTNPFGAMQSENFLFTDFNDPEGFALEIYDMYTQNKDPSVANAVSTKLRSNYGLYGTEDPDQIDTSTTGDGLPDEDDLEATQEGGDQGTGTGTDGGTPQATSPNDVTYTQEGGGTYTGTGSYQPTFFGTDGTGFTPQTGTFVLGQDTGTDGTGTLGGTTVLGGTTQPDTPTVTQDQNYEVRLYRNAAGMTTSITFVNGKPTTPIPAGFYPADKETGQQQQQQGVTTTPPTTATYTAPTTPQVSAPQVSAPTPPTVTPVTGYTPQFNTAGQGTNMQQPNNQQMNMNQGGVVPYMPTASSGRFGGFKPEAMQRIAQSLGYSGDMNGFNGYLNNNPDKKQRMDNYVQRARQMAEGGAVIRASNGVFVNDPNQTLTVNPSPYVEQGVAPMYSETEGTGTESTTVSLGQYDPRVLNQQFIPQQPDLTGKSITDVQAELAKTPGLPTGATVVPVGTQLEQGQLVSPYSGQVTGDYALPTTLATTTQAMMPTTGDANLMSAVEGAGAIEGALDKTQAAQLGQVAMIEGQQLEESSLSELKAAQGTGIAMDNPVQREIQDGELITGAADAQKAAEFTEQIEAATAEPSQKATVAGQLEGLMQQFEGGNNPPWAAASMRNAMATLAKRGLGASSMAGQAVIQAAMEAALPIAQMDAQTQAQFESQNLSNRQQRAILAAQQRATFLGQEFDQAFQARVANAAKISDVANMNFTAEQQVALENSRIANTMNLTNLSNNQAMVMAEAAALANLDMANLNNRQQAAVQNAQNFLQADLANLSNQQQMELFKGQQRTQALFTDQAALNAAAQFNATSQNQVDQFFTSLQTQTAQFNAAQANAQAQFNTGQVNVIERFNAEINNQRDQFNAQNRLIIDQSNAQWRREIATADTAAVNRANEINAQSLLGYSQQFIVGVFTTIIQ
jgi:hypothetical protein